MRRRRGGLSPEDRDLWSRYSRSAEPLHPVRRDSVPAAMPSPPPRPVAPRAPVEHFRLGQAVRPRAAAHALSPGIASEVAAAPLRMDAKTHKRMSAGKLRPEGRLDLHGMNLDRAHPELTRFVLSAHATGKRLVIVVTGKGKAKPADGPIPARLGVLRHQVPHWLAMPPLSAAVLQVVQAHRSHGGSGAYYVYLRR